MPQQEEIQNQNSEEAILRVASQLLEQSGIDSNDFFAAIQSLKTAKEQNPKNKVNQNKNYIDKTPVYDDVDAFIYKRGDTVSGIWYFRMWDTKRQKAVFRSLKTTSKELAITTAKQLYRDIAGKIERGETLKQITTDELIAIWIAKLEATVTTTPHRGLVKDTFKSKKYWLKNWSTYIKSLHLDKTPIDKIKPNATRGFCHWLDQRPKQTAKHTGNHRSREQINNNTNEVLKMYRQLAVADRYISSDDVPQIERLPYEVDDTVKRDIPTDLEYEQYWRYLNFNYITKKHNPDVPPEELEKRKIFKEFILLLANTGMRSKECLGLKAKEITDMIKQTPDDIEKGNIVITIRKENAKTGRMRQIVAPVRKRFERIFESYKKLGILHDPDDYVFLNPNKNSKFYRQNYGRMIMNNRMKDTLKRSGMQEQLDKEDRSLSLYSFRHYFCYLRLIHQTPIHLLASQMGTSVLNIERTYGHINTQLHSEELTKGMGVVRRTETSLETYPALVDR